MCSLGGKYRQETEQGKIIFKQRIKRSVMSRIKEDYEKMVLSGMFWEFYPELTGQWEQDKDVWMEMVERREVKNNYTQKEIQEVYIRQIMEDDEKSGIYEQQ
jgi:hypothetical protein